MVYAIGSECAIGGYVRIYLTFVILPDDISVKHISMSRKSLMLLNETRFVAKRRLTQQTHRNTVMNRNAMQGFDNDAFESSN